MTVEEILEILENIDYKELEGKVKKLIENNPIDFTLDDVVYLIYQEETDDLRLRILCQDIQKNGILLYWKNKV